MNELPSDRVSRNTKIKNESSREVRLAVVKNEGLACTCSCGWSDYHHRDKVREDKIDRHLKKKHGGQGIRL